MTTKAWPRSGAGHAFSLVELIAVLSIIGVLAATCAPVLATVQQNRARAAARQVQRDLTFARQRAVATGLRTWVDFDAQTDSYRILVERVDPPGLADATVLADHATGRTHRQRFNQDAFGGVGIRGVGLDGGNAVGFDWLGAPLNASETALRAAGIVTLTDGTGVRIETVTGYITTFGF